MFKAMMFKEWLKIRWTLAVMFLISLAVLANIWVNLVHALRFTDPGNFWSMIIFRKYVFYQLLQFVPALSGLAVAIAQFLPEIHQHRLKLTLRLPLAENRIIFQMTMVGFISLFALFLGNLSFLLLMAAMYFPREIVISVLFTSAPWFMAGITAYFAICAILIEPLWSRRIILSILFYGFLQIFFQPAGLYAYNRVIPLFLALTLVVGLSVYYTVHRYQKGVV